MKTVSAEQFKQQYGDQAVGRFKEINTARFGATNEAATGLVSQLAGRYQEGISGMVENAPGAIAGDTQSRLRFLGRPLGALGRAFGDVVGAGVSAVTPDSVEQRVGEAVAPVAAPVLERFEKLKATNPQLARDIEDALGLTELTGLGLASKPLAGATRATTRQVADTATDAARRATTAVTDTPIAQGVAQTTQEMAERVPRFVSRVQQSMTDAATRSQRIQTSAPAVQTAIKSGLDNKVINTVQQADAPTLQAYTEMLDIAENASDTLKPAQRPAVVAGNAAAEQLQTVVKQRQAIGKQIGEAAAKLAEKADVPMQPVYDQLDGVLEDIGIIPTYTESGVKLDFSKTAFTKAQRTKIQELYDLATEGGKSLKATQLYQKDRLFSQLQRETRMEGIGDIIVDVPGVDQPMSLFRVFRDVYSNKLDALAPEIRDLNRQYRNLSTIVDDVENSIFKTPNFEITKASDPAEFAKVNLRRILSEAQSQGAYQEIAELLDTTAREYGYSGARPDDLIAFSEALKDIYPDTVPATSFRGGISGGIRGIAERVLDAGRPDVGDQQKALRAMLEELAAQAE